tara:strand:- start:47 stop:1321 length:1275 start_codon:yes stop_codon:yes gene_type:complete
MPDSPKEAEAAQALFSAIADYLGASQSQLVLNVKTYPTYEDFKSNPTNASYIDLALKEIRIPQVSLASIEGLLTKDVTWYESSVHIANKIINEIDTIDEDFSRIKRADWDDFIYVRGGKKEKKRSANAMENIGALFSIANSNDPFFGDINKWSPADIYFVSDTAETAIKNEVTLASGNKLKSSYNFIDLNDFTAKLLDSGDLLPLSLKKADKNVHIVKMNFERSEEEKNFANIKYYGVSDWSKKYTMQAPTTRDIKIYFSKDKKEKLKIRHDPYSSRYGINPAVKAEIEVTGAGGRGGSAGSLDIITNIIKQKDAAFAAAIQRAFDGGLKNFTAAIEALNQQYNIPAKGQKEKLPKPQHDKYKQERGKLSGLHISNAMMPVIYKWFKNNEGTPVGERVNNNMLRAFIEYTSSRTIKSGKFVIAK